MHSGTDRATLLASCVQAETPSTDRPALLAFFVAADGENWKNKENWGVDGAPVSSWHGVSVNSYDRVVKIELPDNNLKGIRRYQIAVFGFHPLEKNMVQINICCMFQLPNKKMPARYVQTQTKREGILLLL